MTATNVQLNDLHKAHWGFRDVMAGNGLWPTPDPAAAASYALQEIGEALDAESRRMRPTDRRNSQRTTDVAGELGDCWFMISTMWGRDDLPGVQASNRSATLKRIALAVALAAEFHETGDWLWRAYAVDASGLIVEHLRLIEALDVAVVVKKRLWRIFWKRVHEQEMRRAEIEALHQQVTAVLGPES
jgi:hypothetical protein